MSAPTGSDIELLKTLAGRIDQHDPGAFNNLGVLYFSKGLLSDAIASFLRALELDPRMRTAARNLTIAAAAPGACDAHLAALDERIALHPDDRQVAHERARLLRLIGRHHDAVQAFDGLIADDPDDALALFERGLIEQHAGDLRRAQRWFERASNAAPGDAVARLHLAETLYHRGQNEQSLEALDRLLELAPDLADAHLLRGFVLGDMGHAEEGAAAARRAAALNPSLGALEANLSLDGLSPSQQVLGVEPGGGLARYGLGLAFRQRGYFAEARREFERAGDAGEDARLVTHAIAELDLVTGQFDAARTAYETLLSEEPEDARHWNEHGVALHQAGDLDGAARSYRRALRADPRHALAYNNLGVALADAGEGTAAREAFVQAAALDAMLVTARLNVARWDAGHDDSLGALATLRELVAFHPRNADAWVEMGRALVRLHRTEEAREVLLRAIECRENHGEARYALADVLNALGDNDGAVRETQRALALSSVRVEARLAIAIALQAECPEAIGGINLLAMTADAPLAGMHVDASDVSQLLPETPRADAGAEREHPPADACREADEFAARGLHGEALERYLRVRNEIEGAGESASRQAQWRKAAIGEARSLCLLGEGHEALGLLRRIGATAPRDPETLALFASSAASASRRHLVPTATARAAMLAVLRLDSPGAALLHFVGDAAIAIGDDALGLALYRRALALDPTRPSARVAIATLLRRGGDLLAARLELAAALAVNAGWGDALVELARVHRDAQEPMQALNVLARHLAASPTDIAGIVLLAELLIILDRDEDARIAVARILRHSPEDPGGLWFDGVLQQRRGRHRDAVDRWRRGALGAPGDHYAMLAARALSSDDHDRAASAMPERRMSAVA